MTAKEGLIPSVLLEITILRRGEATALRTDRREIILTEAMEREAHLPRGVLMTEILSARLITTGLSVPLTTITEAAVLQRIRTTTQNQNNRRPAPQRKPKPSVPEGFATKDNTKANNHNFDKKKKTDDDNRKKRPAFKDKGIIEDEERFGSKKIHRKDKLREQPKPEPVKIEKAIITGDTVSIKTFAEKIGKPVAEILKKLFLLGIMSTINSDIDFDTAMSCRFCFGN